MLWNVLFKGQSMLRCEGITKSLLEGPLIPVSTDDFPTLPHISVSCESGLTALTLWNGTDF